MIVIVELAAPSARTEPVPVIVEGFPAGPAVNTTVPPVKLTGDVKAKVLVSALVEVKVQVETPDELVLEQVT